MATATAQPHLHPLTLEARSFLNSVKNVKEDEPIDWTLANTLESLLTEIDKLFSKQIVNPSISTEETETIVQKITYHCSKCKMDIGRTVEQASAHLENNHHVKTSDQRRREKRADREQEKSSKSESKSKAKKEYKLPKKAKSLITNDISKFLIDNLQIAEKLKQLPEYDQVEKELLELITPIFPNKSIKIYKFGSRVSGTGTRDSDLDVFVDIGHTFNTFHNRAPPRACLNLTEIANAMKKKGNEWKQVNAIVAARVPILKVLNAQTSLQCDIGFTNSLGVCNTKLIEYLLELQPMTRRMVIFLKKWTERTKVKIYLTSYGMTLMVIFFLQINKHLPSIQALQSNLAAPQYIGPWIGNFMEKSLSDLNIEKLSVDDIESDKQLKAFFEYYANFNFKTWILCPYLGKVLPQVKANFDAAMPEHYQKYVRENGQNSSFTWGEGMFIQDPLQMNHNVAKNMWGERMKIFTDYLQQSIAIFPELK